MLKGLGRWLRIAGYDTLIITGNLPDEAIYLMAKADKRLLLTCDHHFLEMNDEQKLVAFLHSNTLDECAKEVAEKLHVNWLHNPFSRCLVCNTPLVELNDPSLLVQVPEDVRTSKIFYCQGCPKLYWHGSHTERMHKQLLSWSQGNA